MIRMFINLAHDDAFWRGIRYAVLIILCRLAADGIMAHASDDVTETMARVEQALVQAGYADAAGYSKLSPPAVEYNEFVAGNGWGSYRPGRIEISTRQPAGCVPITLAHELAHDLSIRMGLIDGVPNDEINQRLHEIASLAEAAMDAQKYAPNCLMKRSAL